MQPAVAIEVGSPAGDMGRQFCRGPPRKHPEHVGPEAAVSRSMGIALLIAEGMMLAVVGNPEQRRTLSRHPTQPGKEQPDRPPSRETAVREQPMVAHTHAKTTGYPIKREADRQA